LDVVFIARLLLLVVILIGFWGVLFKKNLIMKIIAMDIMNTGAISLFVLSSWYRSKAPVIAEKGSNIPTSDPVPQAVILTAIVVGFSVLALLVVYVMDLSRYFHTLDTDRIQNRWKQ
jgi:multicomponent Na+:H+ antiporter subunit C